MKEGWDAKGLLKPLWLKNGGREAVAKAAGVSQGHMSKVNAGKTQLGIDAARRLAAAMNVSLAELGGPAEEDDPKSRGLVDRLVRLEAQAVTAADVFRLTEPLREAIEFLARGNRREALRALSALEGP